MTQPPQAILEIILVAEDDSATLKLGLHREAVSSLLHGQEAL